MTEAALSIVMVDSDAVLGGKNEVSTGDGFPLDFTVELAEGSSTGLH